ncbi:MAG: adenylosuccinate synthase [Bacilli bacterium]|nr:adenylosuccinate synthase [Bacilli bacterium]MDD4077908.1 adenylosuccinate synthase [Bacilli bacterium]
MSKTVVVVGTQWGDEGKGKITNFLSEKSDFVVRYQGGDNAGHTICFNNTTYKLHLIPSGVFNPKITNILGNGMVVNVKKFLDEVENLRKQGFAVDNVFISDRAHVIFDYHILLDGISEDKLGKENIGTTKRGIGPAYTDKIARRGIRISDFIGEDFKETLKKRIIEKNKELKIEAVAPLDFDDFYQKYLPLCDKIKPFVIDSVTVLNQALAEGKNILFEGAQGALLDVDFGSYPYVTSSNPSAGGVCCGSGIGPTYINEIVGIVKAYSTRVGSGTFPTELLDATGHYIREVGREYGTTTKRPRRIGWFDAVVLNYSKMINGLTGISIMLLDVLTGLKQLKICTGYSLDGKIIKTVPASLADYNKCIPIYEELPGWDDDITAVKSFCELPINAQNYLRRIEELTGLDVVIFSVGPDKNQTIVCRDVFA